MNALAKTLITSSLVACTANFALAGDQCLACHSALGDKPSTAFLKDIHYTKGITCAGCHGGNASKEDQEEAMNKKAGYIGAPKGNDISAACAACHSSADRMKQYGSTIRTDQWSELQTSVHAKLSVTGKELIVQCTTCHNAHGIVRPDDRSSPVHPLNVVSTCAKCHSNASFMRLYNPALPVDQVEKYHTSVHGQRNANGDRKAAECVSCHGNHGIRSVADTRSTVFAANLPGTCAKCHSDAPYMKQYNIPTDQFTQYSTSVHGVALLQKKDLGAPACNDCHGNHGATPPGVESISKVCGTCHALNADLFSSSPHKKAFDERRLPECETCHGNHGIKPATVTMLGTGDDALCSRCHSATTNAKGFETAHTMRNLVDSLERSTTRARELVDEAEQKGMEVGEAQFRLRDVRQAQLESRTMVHAFNAGKFQEVVDKGLLVAAFVADEGSKAIEEYRFRRIGLGVSTGIVTVLAISLGLYIRKLERHQQQKKQ